MSYLDNIISWLENFFNSVINNDTMTQLVSFQTVYLLCLALDFIGLVETVVLDVV